MDAELKDFLRSSELHNKTYFCLGQNLNHLISIEHIITSSQKPNDKFHSFQCVLPMTYQYVEYISVYDILTVLLILRSFPSNTFFILPSNNLKVSSSHQTFSLTFAKHKFTFKRPNGHSNYRMSIENIKTFGKF